MFEFLFKYRPIAFEEGELVFVAPAWVETAVLVGFPLGVLATVTYVWTKGRASPRDKVALAGLRVLLLAAVGFCLLHPTLVLRRVAPQQNFVGVLLDNSRSMNLSDGERTRADAMRESFGAESPLTAALAERFTLRHFEFDDDVDRVSSTEELTFDGTRTDIGHALATVNAELTGVPLAGLIVVSDGVSNTSTALAESLVPLQAAGVPVYTVGVGEEAISPDIEMGRVEMPRNALVGSRALVDVVVTQRGMRSGERVPLVVEDEVRILAEQEIELAREGEPAVARVPIELDVAGPRVVRFRIPAQPGEEVAQNNERSVHMNVRDGREKVLYFEGEPRFEVKFMRRAVADDENLQLVVLQRTAESKFLRLDVDDGSELEFGFPTEREELYRYRGLIIGSVEASFFTHDQLAMIADFVSERGGGVLFLGGSRAFAEGGWDGTPVEAVMPVLLDDPVEGSPAAAGTPDDEAEAGGAPPVRSPERYFAQVKVEPTRAGLSHPAVRLDAELDGVEERWAELPAVTLVNPISDWKSGATPLLSGRSTVIDAVGTGTDGPVQAVLVHQRYGRGKSIALTIQDSWLWQMHADVPVDDMAHEVFWRQMIRWLVDGVPETMDVVAERQRVEPGETVRLLATLRDSVYSAVNGAAVVGRVTAPSGRVTEIPAEWTVERDGEYAFELRPEEAGEHTVEVVAARGGVALDSVETFVVAAPASDEFFGAGQDAATLRRIAEATGGRYYAAADLATLAEDIELSGGGVTLVESLDLWDMPAFFFAMIALMGTEWGWRRRRGLS